MKMPFGKYRGVELTDVPFEYLSWLIEQDFLREPLRTLAEEEFDRRTYQPLTEPLPLPIDCAVAEELLSAGLRVLAKKYHPDLGGNAAEMVALNNCVDWFRSKLKGGE